MTVDNTDMEHAPGGSPARERCLFVLSRDHGELFNAMYFASGMSMEPVLLMPPGLFELNAGTLPYRSFRYRGLSDIDAVIETERPDVALLFSAYLYVVNGIFETERSLEKLVAGLRERGIAFATSDPALGLVSNPDADTFDTHHPRQRWMIEHFSLLGGLLAPVDHLYLAPGPVATRARSRSYFNSRGILDEQQCQALRSRVASWDGVLPDRERWLFVLSPEDLAVQAGIHGRKAFARMLADRLKDAVKAGCQPLLIAPTAIIDLLRPRAVEIPGLVALPSCNYGVFMSLLHEAQYVFYWNEFSASILARVINCQPFFVFDKGHLSHVLKSLPLFAEKHFFEGWAPQILDAAAALRDKGLEPLAVEQTDRILPAIRDYLAASAAPDAVLGAVKSAAEGEP